MKVSRIIGGDELVAWRLASHKLSTGRLDAAEQVVEWLGGVQAQDERRVEWSLGLRTEGCNQAQVEQALREHKIIHTWMFRGTLHYVNAADLAWLTGLLAPGIIRGNARRYRQLGLDDAAFDRSQKVIRQALEEKSPLTRSAIKVHFERDGIPSQGQQVPYLLQRAALEGLVCLGPRRGRELTFTLIPAWIDVSRVIDRVDALVRLAERYFASHAPAMLQDFAWWSGLSMTDVRSALEGVPGAVSIDFLGRQYWATGDLPAGFENAAHLLPPFDEYLLGYKERSLVLDPRHTKKVNAGGGVFKPTVMVNGEILAIWKDHDKKGEKIIEVQPFRPLSTQEVEWIDGAAKHFGFFYSKPVTVQYRVERDEKKP